MADETEKQRLLKRIEHLQGVMRGTRSKEYMYTGSSTSAKPSSAGYRRQPTSSDNTKGKGQQLTPTSQGSSAIERLQFKSHCQFPQGCVDQNRKVHTSTENNTPPNQMPQQCSDRTVLQKGNSNCAQAHLKQEHVECGASQTGKPVNNSKAGGGVAKEAEMGDVCTAVIQRIIVAAASSPEGLSCVKKSSVSVSQNNVCGRTQMNRMKNADLPVQKPSLKLKATPDQSLTKSSASTDLVPAHTHTAQFYKDHLVIPNSATQDKQILLGLGRCADAKQSSQSFNPTKTRKSSRKAQLALKNAEVIAARESMQNKLDLFKSTLAQLEETKRNKKSEAHNKTGSIKACHSHSGKGRPRRIDKTVVKVESPGCGNKNMLRAEPENVASVGDHHVSSKQPSAINKTVESTGCENKNTLRVEPANVASLADNHVSRKHPPAIKTESSVVLTSYTESQCTNGKITEKQRTAKTPMVKMEGNTCLSTKSNSQRSTPGVGLRLDNGTSNKRNTRSVSSPSKTAAKENLQKELKATEDKLKDMRKKIGTMLKDSPPNLSQSVSATAAVQRTHQKRSSLNVDAAAYLPVTMSSSAPTTKPTPFLNRKSSKWTPEKSGLRNSSERVLVVGSSPNLRCFQNTTSKTNLPEQSLHEDKRNQSFLVSGRPSRNTPKGKKSQYTFIRKTGKPTLSSAHSLSNSKTTVTPVQKRQRGTVTKTFVDRYKLQRGSNNSPKDGSSSTDSARNVIVKSPYKLRKVSSAETSFSQPCFSGTSGQVTALHRAARVVKSKYKLRKVPVLLNGEAFPKLNQYVSQCRLPSQTFQVPPRNAWTMKSRKYKGFSSSSNCQYNYHGWSRFSDPSTGRFQQASYNPAYIYGEPWRRHRHLSASDWLWAKQQMKKDFLRRQRAKAAKALRRRWTHQAHGMVYPQWQTKAFQIKTVQLQKKLLMKRLHWSRKYSQSRTQACRRDSSSLAVSGPGQTRDRLVMINDILYKSSGSRLTRASASVCGLRLRGSGTAISPLPGSSPASSRLRGSVVIRNVKQRKMQTVTVRGVSFTVNDSGTRLQRINVSATEGKKALSRVDIGGTTYVQTQDGVLEKLLDSQTRSVISRAKQRSISLAAAKMRKDKTKSKTKTCLFYSRFGKCSRGEQCPFEHDPAKIAVCTRFLRGTCRVEDCPFSHKVSKEKMPVCAFFMRGVCTRDPCPYLHVKVSQGAEICQDFVAGFCALAEKCPKLHTLTCPFYSKSGTCPDGKKCRLQHRKANTARKHHRVKSPASATSENSASVPQRGSKRSAFPENQPVSQQDRADQSPPPPKHLKTGENRQHQTVEHDSNSLLTNAGASAKLEGDTPSHSQGRATGDAERGEGCKAASPQKLAKLPAFISLLDYSMEESPTPRLHSAKDRNTSTPSRGSSLQIKPRI